jgi:hypothetical protein
MRLSSSSRPRRDDGLAEGHIGPEADSKDVSMLPVQLGSKLRDLYSVEEAEAASDRLAELIGELEARERARE